MAGKLKGGYGSAMVVPSRMLGREDAGLYVFSLEDYLDLKDERSELIEKVKAFVEREWKVGENWEARILLYGIPKGSLGDYFKKEEGYEVEWVR